MNSEIYKKKYNKYILKLKNLRGGGLNYNEIAFDLRKIGIDSQNALFYTCIIMMLFSNLYRLNAPYKMLQSKKYDEFKRQYITGVTNSSCNFNKSFTVRQQAKCNQEDIKNFNTLNDEKTFVCYKDYENSNNPAEEFISQINEKYLNSLKFLNVNVFRSIPHLALENIHYILVDSENIHRNSKNYDKYIENLIIHHYHYYDGIPIVVFAVSKYKIKSIYNAKFENTIFSATGSINFFYHSIVVENFTEDERRFGRNIHRQLMQGNTGEEKNDIDDCAIVYLYVYIKFILQNANCYITSNDSYKWFSLPLMRISLDEVMLWNGSTDYIIKYFFKHTTTCSDEINDIYNKYFSDKNLLMKLNNKETYRSINIYENINEYEYQIKNMIDSIIYYF